MQNLKIENSTISTNIFWKFFERTFTQLVNISVSILLARLLLPEDYGTLTMVIVFTTIAEVILTSGLANALIQKKNSNQKDFSSVFYFNLVISVVLYLIIFLISPYVADYYNYIELSLILRVVGIKIIFVGIISLQSSYASKKMQFKQLFRSTFFGTVISGIIGIALAFKGYGVWALVFQQLSYNVLNFIGLWTIIRWRPSYYFSFKRVKGLFLFGWKLLFESLSDTVVNQFNNILIGRFYTPNDLGNYSKAQQFPSLLVGNLTSSLGAVLFPAMSKYQKYEDEVLNLLRKSIVISSYLLFPALCGLFIIAESFVIILLTEKWLPIVPYIRIFVIINGLTIGMVPRHQALNSIGRSDVFMIEHFFSRILGLVILFIVYSRGILIITIGTAISSLFLAIIVMYTSKKYNGYNYSQQLKDIIPIILLTLFMGFTINFISFLDINVYFKLFFQVTLGASIYIIFSIFLNFKAVELIKMFINNNLLKYKKVK